MGVSFKGIYKGSFKGSYKGQSPVRPVLYGSFRKLGPRVPLKGSIRVPTRGYLRSFL